MTPELLLYFQDENGNNSFLLKLLSKNLDNQYDETIIKVIQDPRYLIGESTYNYIMDRPFSDAIKDAIEKKKRIMEKKAEIMKQNNYKINDFNSKRFVFGGGIQKTRFWKKGRSGRILVGKKRKTRRRK